MFSSIFYRTILSATAILFANSLAPDAALSKSSRENCVSLTYSPVDPREGESVGVEDFEIAENGAKIVCRPVSVEEKTDPDIAFAFGRIAFLSDAREAARYFLNAEKRGSVSASYHLGMIYAQGLVRGKDSTDALFHFATGMKRRSSESSYMFGVLKLPSLPIDLSGKFTGIKSVVKNRTDALSALVLAEREGSKVAKFLLSALVDVGWKYASEIRHISKATALKNIDILYIQKLRTAVHYVNRKHHIINGKYYSFDDVVVNAVSGFFPSALFLVENRVPEKSKIIDNAFCVSLYKNRFLLSAKATFEYRKFKKACVREGYWARYMHLLNR